MLDIKLLRQDPTAVITALNKRGGSFAIDQVLEEDGKRRTLVYEMEQLRAEQNVASDAIGAAKKAKQDASEAIAAMKTIKDRIAVLEEQVREVDATLADLWDAQGFPTVVLLRALANPPGDVEDELRQA